MKTSAMRLNRTFRIVLSVVVIGGGFAFADDLYLGDGIFAEIDSTIDGSLFIGNARVNLYENAHILGFVITESGAVLDIYGGQIDYMLLISTSDNTLPEGLVTVYGRNFAVNGVPVDPATTELFLQGQTLSGVYDTGTPFAMVVDCAISGSAANIYYQTIKLGWVASEPDIALSQTDYNFGQTDVGTTQAGIVTVFNLGNASLTIQSLSLTQDGTMQFSFTPLQVLPVTLVPDGSIDIEILYSPTAQGAAQGTLSIFSDDPDGPVVDIALVGEGLAVVLTPEEQIADILDFYAQAAEEGVLRGVGRGKSAGNKIQTLEKMLCVAQHLIDAGQLDEACETLRVVEKKCDGQKSPADFVQGDGAAALNAMIRELMAALGNQ
ncbi:MAG: choice-of-anchor D domain-containing protein [Planctomycetales bacterium]|nr:choice-of-anchor D domain-containing protein [Planctomycetales bacterium]